MKKKSLIAKKTIHKSLLNYLKDRRVKKIFYDFNKHLLKFLNSKSRIAVAISGGPDSLALAFLTKCFLILNKLDSKFFIVDHKLRSESTKEAKVVKDLLKQILITPEILTWKGKKPSKNIQSLARKKRYELIYKRCDKYKINNILTGHHQDDLFENFFIRLLRGSGLKGLISLDKENKIGDKNLLRPLLDQKKEDLVFLSKNVFNFYVQDPTNNDEKYHYQSHFHYGDVTNTSNFNRLLVKIQAHEIYNLAA